MAAKTTSIELKGDRVQARALAEDHVNRLLLDFRKNASFQALPIYSQTKKFYDQTGAFVGTIYMQTVNGAESIVVSCGSGKKEEEDHLEMEKITPIIEIVPCLRSTDNHWWVACLSGTFDGPYYAFENVGDAFTPEMMDDNVEIDLDNQLLSIGQSQINGSTTYPELVFIAQTGILPPALTTQNIDPGPDYQPSIDNQSEVICQKEDVTVNGECPLGVPQSVTVHNYEGVIWGNWSYKNTGSTEVIDEYVVFGAANAYLPHFYSGRYTSYSHTYNTAAGSGLYSFEIFFGSGYFTGCDFFNVQVPNYNATAEELAIQSARDTFALIGWTTADGANSHKVYIEESREMFNGRFALRIEQTYANRFCCGYTLTNATTTDTRTATDTACEAETDVTTSNTTSTEYSDYFQVDDRAYLLQGPMTTHSPTYGTGNNMMKYYGTDSVAETTGLMAAILDHPADDEFAYHYVGPNNENELSVTVFPGYGSPFRKHVVPDVQNLPDGVEFYGEIFLGQIRYSKTEKVKLY